MPDYQPYLIADYAFGEHRGKEAWLAPEAAFRTLRNGYVKNGQLRKRGGYELLDDIGVSLPIMGLIENRMLDGSSELIAMSTKRLYRLESGVFVDRAGSDVWTGADTNFFAAAHASDDALYLVNGVDVPKKWIGLIPSLASAATTGLTNVLNWAKWAIWWKGRLWYFFTNEAAGSVRYPQRARFSSVNQPEVFRDVDFIEATTSERMTGVKILGDRIIVQFEESAWTIVQTGDFRLPFVFRQIPSTYGAVGTHASFLTNDLLVCMSRFGLMGNNGDRVEKIDPELPRLVDSIAPDKHAYVYGGRDALNQQGWLLFVETGDITGKPNDALIYDWENGSFSFFELPMHVVGSFRASSSVVWSDLTEPWDSYAEAWDDFGGGEDAPIFLGGDRLGNVWKLNTGVTDGKTTSVDGTPYTMIARSQQLNPFKGIKARMGFLDIYCSSSMPSSTAIRVKVYRDEETAPVVVSDINLEATDAALKVMRRISVNKTAGFFTIEIEHSIADTVAVDALRLWMAPVAKGRPF